MCFFQRQNTLGPKMILHYALPEDAFFDYNVYYSTQSPAQQKHIQKWRTLPPLVWTLMAVSSVVFLNTLELHIRIMIVLACSIASIVWYIRYPGIFERAIIKVLKRWFAEGKYNEYIGDFTLELTEDGLRESAPGRVTEVGYDKIQSIIEDKRWIYIFVGSITAIIVPYAAFATREDKEHFIAVLEEKRSVAAG